MVKKKKVTKDECPFVSKTGTAYTSDTLPALIRKILELLNSEEDNFYYTTRELARELGYADSHSIHSKMREPELQDYIYRRKSKRMCLWANSKTIKEMYKRKF